MDPEGVARKGDRLLGVYGAFLLAEAGILDGLACATHWAEADLLQRRYPKVKVRKGVLFVHDGNVFTSAGVASGIDLAIHLIGLRYGEKLAFQIARSLVIYLRRGGGFEQESIYLQYRNHLDDMVHWAQSILIEKLDKPPTLGLLSAGSRSRLEQAPATYPAVFEGASIFP